MRVITITDNGYLASLPKTGPNLVVFSKIQKMILSPETAKRWTVRVAGQHWEQ